MLHLRQGLVSGYQADPLHHLNITNAHLGRFNRFEFGILAPAITKNYSNFGDLGVIEISSPTPRNGRWCSDSGSSSVIEFSTMSSLEDESDVSSPPLWKTSLPATPTTMASVLHHLSPTPQSQEIARGHHELMEIIRNMPESAYDLSLKDIVELSTAGGEKRGSTSEAIRKGKMKRSIINNNKRHDLRNGNMNHRDFLLKMFLPSALGPKKRSSNNGICSKVSPKPQQMEGEKIGLETEWWKKRLSSARESVNSRTSRSSSCSNGRSSSRRHMCGCLHGCCSFFQSNKSRK